jgi:hypothetical protein
MLGGLMIFFPISQPDFRLLTLKRDTLITSNYTIVRKVKVV